MLPYALHQTASHSCGVLLLPLCSHMASLNISTRLALYYTQLGCLCALFTADESKKRKRSEEGNDKEEDEEIFEVGNWV